MNPRTGLPAAVDVDIDITVAGRSDIDFDSARPGAGWSELEAVESLAELIELALELLELVHIRSGLGLRTLTLLVAQRPHRILLRPHGILLRPHRIAPRAFHLSTPVGLASRPARLAPRGPDRLTTGALPGLIANLVGLLLIVIVVAGNSRSRPSKDDPRKQRDGS